jgi:signal transduction histidine kinase/CheY-like chemotaxis protein/HPt (histidine-containing phosphotransfer) domain-containing protein
MKILQDFNFSESAAIRRRFRLFSCIVFAIILCAASVTFFISSNRIGRSTLENKLSLAVEAQRLHLAMETGRELALVSRMADSRVIQRHFLDPTDPALKEAALEEFAEFRKNLKNNAIFWVSDKDKLFYSDQDRSYRVDPSDPENYWYDMTLYRTEKYNLNINYNPDLHQINLWVNAPVFQTLPDESKIPIGMVGTGINLAGFFDAVYRDSDSLITLYLFNSAGEITVAKDRDLVFDKVLLTDHLGSAGEMILGAAGRLANTKIETFVHDGVLYAVCVSPQLQWYLTGSIPLTFSTLFNPTVFVVFVSVVLLALFIVVVFNIFISRVSNEIEEKNRSLFALNVKAHAASEESKSKSSFLARMSHEIRTPMNAIIGMSELAQREHGTPKALDYIAGIQSASASLLAIVNDILDFSKIGSGQFTLVPTPYETAGMLNDALNVIRIRLGEKPIELIISVDPSLPAVLLGDATRVRQVLLNMLSNAVKYTDKGVIRFSVSWQEVPGDAALLTFTVADSGIGIRSENLSRLFGDFVRVDDEHNKSIEGTGLGLAITRSLCRAMDGDVMVESEYGKGSTFTATLRQNVSDKRPMGALERRKAPRTDARTPHALERLKAARMGGPIISFTAPDADILLVDDMPANLLVAEGLLAPYKARIVACQSGREAVELARSHAFDLIFMDHMMPGMDGMEATAAIRGMGKRGKMPIIALTANAVSGMREMFLQNGFNDFLSKPIEIPKLVEIMEKWIPADKRGPAPEAVASGDAETARLPIIEGVDTPTGLSHAGGVPRRYLDLLAMFCRDARTRLPLLDRTPAEEECQSFTTQVHALKSALASIGAADLAVDAARLENAGHNGDIPAINDRLPAFREDLEGLLERIGAALAQARPAADTTGKGEGGGQPSARERALLAQLKTALEQKDLDAMDKALEDMKSLPLIPETSDALSGIEEYILLADFEKAAAAIDTLDNAKETG